MSDIETLQHIGEEWAAARRHERDIAAAAYLVIRQAAVDGIPETRIAELMSVDRMTVRRALGKL